MKSLFVFLTAFAVSWLTASAEPMGVDCTAKMSLKAGDTRIAVDETATVKLVLGHDCSLYAWQAFIVPSDPGVLVIESATFEPGSPFDLQLVNAIHGDELDIAAGATTPVTVSGTLATVTVRGVAAGSSSLVFTLHQPGNVSSAVADETWQYATCVTYPSAVITVK